MTDSKLNDKGMSLVELIIVISIMSVMLVTVGLGTGMLNTRRVDSCAQQFTILLQKCRTMSIGKEDNAAKLILKHDSNDHVIVVETIDGNTTTTEIGKTAITISYKVKGSDLEIELASDEEMEFTFDRSSGALKPISGGSYYSEVIISKGAKKRTIEIVSLTGKISLK